MPMRGDHSATGVAAQQELPLMLASGGKASEERRAGWSCCRRRSACAAKLRVHSHAAHGGSAFPLEEAEMLLAILPHEILEKSECLREQISGEDARTS